MSEATAPKRPAPRQMRGALWRLKWQKWKAKASQRRMLLQFLAALTAVAAFELMPIPGEVFALLAIAVLVAPLFGAALELAISIRPFDLPKEIEQQGWSGEIAARHFGDALLRIEAGARPGQQAFPLRAEQPLPDIEVPRIGLKAATLVDVFRFVVGRPRRELTAEIIGCSGAYRLHGRLNGKACFDVAMSGPDNLSDALQTAAENLARAVALPAFLFFLLPKPSRALSIACDVIDRREGSVTDQTFAAKFATWLTLSGVVGADLGEVPKLIAKSKQLAATALRLSPDDDEAMFLMELVETLPSLEWDKALDVASEGLQMQLRWGDKYFHELVENSPISGDLLREMPNLYQRLNFICALDHLHEEIETARKKLQCAITRVRGKKATEKELYVDEFTLSNNLRSIASELRVPADFIKLFERTQYHAPMSEADEAALIRLVGLLKRTADSIERQMSRLLLRLPQYFRILPLHKFDEEMWRKTEDYTRTHLSELRQSLLEWTEQLRAKPGFVFHHAEPPAISGPGPQMVSEPPHRRPQETVATRSP